VYVHDGKFYAITDNRAFVHTAYKRNVEIDKLDHIFLSRLFDTIGHTQKGETIREKLARAQKQKSQEATSIEEQLGEIEPSINAYQANLELPPDVLDTPKRIEYAQKLTKLRATQTQLIAKLRVIQEDVDTEQDIKEYEDVLNGIRKTLDGFSYEKKLKFVRLVAKSISIEEVSPRWLKIEVVWRGAYAGIDTGFIWCTYGSHNLYTDEEQRVLIALYATASKQVVLNRLRTRSWNSVTHQAKAMGLSRVAQYDDFRMDKGLCMDDVKFMESIGLVYNSAWPNMQPFWYNDKTRQSTNGHHGTTIP